jgi:hypothetical protein
MSSADRRPRSRRTITIDLPPDQISWLDAQANGIMSRSAFARSLIARAMQGSQAPSISDPPTQGAQ